MNKKIEQLIKSKQGIGLDIGGGASPHQGFVNIDMLDLPEVDIVWDLEKTPWPLPDNSVHRAVASHVLEHINPVKGVFIDVMNEIWRVLKPGAQFAFVVPYAGNALYWQDPTHCNGINEVSMYYFDPDPEMKYAGMALYAFYRPKPWKIDFMAYDRNGLLECVLSKRKEDPSFQATYTPEDVTQEFKNVPKNLLR